MRHHFRLPLRAVFYRDGGRWVAHCLEFDLCGDGESRDDALHSLNTAIEIQIDESFRTNNPANLFCPADSKYLQMFAAGKDIAKGALTIVLPKGDSVSIESVEAREYSDGDLVDGDLVCA